MATSANSDDKILLFDNSGYGCSNVAKLIWKKKKILKVHQCRFGNLLIYSKSYKNSTLKISHS